MYSISYNANRYFLTVDPVNHSTRSSGKIIAKVVRGSESVEDFLDFIIYDILSALVRFITVIAVLFYYHFFWV